MHEKPKQGPNINQGAKTKIADEKREKKEEGKKKQI